MKRLLFVPLLLIICLLLWNNRVTEVSEAEGKVNMMLIGVNVTTTTTISDCASGTYEAAYNGDHSSGSDYICYQSGVASEQATADTAEDSSSYVLVDAANEYLRFTITGDLADSDLDSQGTIFFSFEIIDGGDTTWPTEYVASEIVYNGSSSENIHIRTLSSGRIAGYHFGGSGINYVQVTGLSAGTDYRCGYTWCDGADGCNGSTDAHAIRCVTSGSVDLSSPDDEDEESIEGFTDGGAVDPSTLSIGEDYSNRALSGDDDLKIWDVYVVQGYKGSDPGSLVAQ